ncbi:hypothetical protein Smp_132790 [Schistosoma mansoni]|uniref:hypothetical protein n=1 Tax=Schistosoma mansoni TaxID=6183 RepID=UPI00022C82AC|nr:hypothetical protein Smp_132790 [Schistosoma mansoni]|eukprot:XP_018644867.1 hypothetical protein Smp_132790 [Schistosoma mansoni]
MKVLMNTIDVNDMENNGNKKIHLINIESNNLKTCSKRGRKSTVPPELREQTRRIKKQNIERSRRACIANKMSELHKLAMNLIGINISEQQKTEKVDILGMCYEVFKNVAVLLNENPVNKSNGSIIHSNTHQSPSSWNKENYNPTSQNLLIPSELSAFTPIRKIKDTTLHDFNQFNYQSTPIPLPFIQNDSGYYEMNHSSSLLIHKNPVHLRATYMSNEYIYTPQSSCSQTNSIISKLQTKENILENEIHTNHETTKENIMWRPYLD